MSDLIRNLPNLDLRGVRVWLSGAIPEPEGETPDVRSVLENWSGSDLERGILGFVQEFASLVMKYGGEIVHGRHPSFTPILLECARLQRRQNTEALLELCFSDYWPEEHPGDWERWGRVSKITRIAKTGVTENDRDPSLEVLRQYMAERCNAFVAIGGRWWSGVPGRAGVPKEFELAKAKSVPCFVLGGFGGVSKTYIEQNPRWSDSINNCLSVEQNDILSKDQNFVLAAGKIVSQLHILNGQS